MKPIRRARLAASTERGLSAAIRQQCDLETKASAAQRSTFVSVMLGAARRQRCVTALPGRLAALAPPPLPETAADNSAATIPFRKSESAIC